MNLINLTCHEAISLVNNSRYMPYQDNRLFMGGEFTTYLYFELSSLVNSSPLESAKLILYKIPNWQIQRFSPVLQATYGVKPLLDFFSPYSNWYTPPRQAEDITIEYTDQSAFAYAEVDITPIVLAWMRNQPENKGLAITGKQSPVLTYASNFHTESGMRPVLRLRFLDITPALSHTKEMSMDVTR